MSFMVRNVRHEDIGQLFDPAKQFTLLNLPADRKILTEKIDRSVRSFLGEVPKAQAEYLFVVEDLEESAVVGSSLVMAKHGSPEVPHSSFKVLEKNLVSKDLGIGFIHKVLRFHHETDGPTEIGGLLVDKLYRKRPEKVGKQIALSRFVYMGMFPEQFEKRVICELTPPFADEGRSEFWEALGRRFTGLPYQEADFLSQNHKEFISSLFPTEDVYLCLLDSKARLVLGRVAEQTKPAQHLLESIGFSYLNEVDPFDGGPHYGQDFSQVAPIKLGKWMTVTEMKDPTYTEQVMVGSGQQNSADFRCKTISACLRENQIAVPTKSFHEMELKYGDQVFVTPFNFGKKTNLKKEKI